MTTVGIATGAGRGMGLACARRLAAMVDALLVVDLDEAAATSAAADLGAAQAGAMAHLTPADHRAVVEPFVLDVTDRDGLAGLAARVRELGTLRAVVHAAGISPSMAGWRRVLTVDLTGTALLAGALRPLATAGTAMVCFASMAPLLGSEPDPAVARSWTIPWTSGSPTGSARPSGQRSRTAGKPTGGPSAACTGSSGGRRYGSARPAPGSAPCRPASSIRPRGSGKPRPTR
jgi:NAD(P)-dependent dehydrogenase (short-subunit alcohol dehydrogenase family)